MTDRGAPILAGKHYAASSVFTPEGLLREARRQKSLLTATVPPVCVLDPDGDIVRRLVADGTARRDTAWACYRTELYRSPQDDVELGFIGCAVGAPFAVLVAEQLFAPGCRFLISMTSAGQVAALRPTPYFLLIDRALRDEGTSYHYVPPPDFSMAPSDLVSLMAGASDTLGLPAERGATWTTDAPFRETAKAVEAMRSRGLLAVEMEAAT
ncbi:MAG: nucleoside phosphorylase, partial [Burkholderiales bacterium]